VLALPTVVLKGSLPSGSPAKAGGSGGMSSESFFSEERVWPLRFRTTSAALRSGPCFVRALRAFEIGLGFWIFGQMGCAQFALDQKKKNINPAGRRPCRVPCGLKGLRVRQFRPRIFAIIGPHAGSVQLNPPGSIPSPFRR
jgi:hypothetical protein